jgi:hypothetical protein
MAGDRAGASSQAPDSPVRTDDEHIPVAVGVVDKALTGEPLQHHALDGQIAGCASKCGGERGRNQPSGVRVVPRAPRR